MKEKEIEKLKVSDRIEYRQKSNENEHIIMSGGIGVILILMFTLLGAIYLDENFILGGGIVLYILISGIFMGCIKYKMNKLDDEYREKLYK